jgi:hypothetical protein
MHMCPCRDVYQVGEECAGVMRSKAECVAAASKQMEDNIALLHKLQRKAGIQPDTSSATIAAFRHAVQQQQQQQNAAAGAAPHLPR